MSRKLTFGGDERRAARSGPRFGACRFLLLAGYENLTAPLFAFRDDAKLK
jgi:hypothetical protein